MKRVAVIGAGRMSKPIADYFLDRRGYEVIMVDQVPARAERVIGGRRGGRALGIEIKRPADLDGVAAEADIVISMVPRPMHVKVARSCLEHHKSMVTTSYESAELAALAEEANEKGILILNEMGEDPGIDHLGTQMLLDEIRQEGGRPIDIKSFGSGIPAPEHNDNPMGYKFSWHPGGLLAAARTPAAYYKEGRRVVVPAEQLFTHIQLVDIAGLGTFESYPNRDCEKYLHHFAPGKDISFYRGLLRYPGYCSTMHALGQLGLFDHEREESFKDVTYRQFTASLLGTQDSGADIIHCLRWLGFFADRPIRIERGSRQDVLLERMLEKMSYAPHEKDMIIVHIEIIAEFPGKRRERRSATMKVEGIPYGDSAMSRAVGLPAAIGARLILEGRLKVVGAHIPPTIPGLYRPILDELAGFGFVFSKEIEQKGSLL